MTRAEESLVTLLQRFVLAPDGLPCGRPVGRRLRVFTHARPPVGRSLPRINVHVVFFAIDVHDFYTLFWMMRYHRVCVRGGLKSVTCL